MHEPPHFYREDGGFLITATCYEHKPIFEGLENLSMLAETVLHSIERAGLTCLAWVVLPDHDHLLVLTEDLRRVSEVLRRTHSFLST